jgi:hypothetical protein
MKTTAAAKSSAPAKESVAETEPKTRNKRPRVTFMLHAPGTFENLGKFQSSDARYAALKCASRGHKNILLRKTNTSEISEYTGEVQDLPEPKHITRGDPPRTITYSKKPVVKFVKKFMYTGPTEEIDAAAANDKAQ